MSLHLYVSPLLPQQESQNPHQWQLVFNHGKLRKAYTSFHYYLHIHRLLTGLFMRFYRLVFFALFGIYAINALIARFAEGPMAFWYWPILSAGAILSFWPLDLLMNIFGALFILVTVIHSHIWNSAAAHPKT